MLHSRLGLSARGLRINDEASIVAVALHLTMCTYGKFAPESQISTDAERTRLTCYDDVLWNGLQTGRRLLNSDSGNARLVEAEILGSFFACLVDAASLRYLRNVEWQRDLRESLFLPAWIVARSGQSVILRSRRRVSERAVQRLIDRYPPELKLREYSMSEEGRIARGYFPTSAQLTKRDRASAWRFFEALYSQLERTGTRSAELDL